MNKKIRALLSTITGLAAGTCSVNALAGAADIRASWSLDGGTSVVPAMSGYALVLLAVLVALLMYRGLSKNPRIANMLVTSALVGGVTSVAVWTTDVSSGDSAQMFNISTPEECANSIDYYDGEVVGLDNGCPGNLRVTYQILLSECTLETLQCEDTGLDCVSDGGVVAQGDIKELLGCIREEIVK